jgi:glycosyltransferase involved in cell wall biosynthesis
MTIDIIIPYNTDRGFLHEALNSILLQKYDESIIKIGTILSKSDKGVSVNLNYGIKQTTGDLVRYLCEDDLLTRNSISDTVQYFIDNPDVDFIHSNAIEFNSENEITEYKPPILIPKVTDKYCIHGGTVTYRTRCFEHRLFDETLWTGEEYDFNLYLLKNGYKIGYLDSFTYKYRHHELQKSIGNMTIDYQQLRLIEKNKIKARYV